MRRCSPTRSNAAEYGRQGGSPTPMGRRRQQATRQARRRHRARTPAVRRHVGHVARRNGVRICALGSAPSPRRSTARSDTRVPSDSTRSGIKEAAVCNFVIHSGGDDHVVTLHETAPRARTCGAVKSVVNEREGFDDRRRQAPASPWVRMRRSPPLRMPNCASGHDTRHTSQDLHSANSRSKPARYTSPTGCI